MLLTMPFCSVNGSGRMAKAAGSQRSGKRADKSPPLRKRPIWDWMIRDRLFAPLIGREIEMLVRQMLLQAVLVGDDKGDGIGTLVVIQDQLVDRGRVFGERLLDPFRAVFLSVTADQQALETSEDIEQAVMPYISHISGVEPPVADGLGGRCRVLPVAGHHIFASYDDLSLFACRKLFPVGIAYFQVERTDQHAALPKVCRSGPLVEMTGSRFASP